MHRRQFSNQLGKQLGATSLGHIARLGLVLKETAKLSSQASVPTSGARQSPCSERPRQAIPSGFAGYSSRCAVGPHTCRFSLRFLGDKRCGAPFHTLTFQLCLSLRWRPSFVSLAHFLIKMFFPTVESRGFFVSFGYKSFVRCTFANIFSLCVAHLFILLTSL